MIVENTDYRQEFLDLGNPFDIKLINNFLTELGFFFDPKSVQETIVLYNLNNDIIGTGSLQNNIIKYVAVAPKYRETTAFPIIISQLTEKAISKHKTVFVFTKPRNIVVFKGLGFKHIATSEPHYALLEYGINNIKHYQKNLEKYKQPTKTDNIASIVMNCNPFTKGHKFLIEKAASENELVYLFVVEENMSVFPFDIRWKLIKDGIKDLNNVVMIPGGDYIISGKTFPQYFLCGITQQDITNCQGELDIKIFANYIAPILNIKKRYAGTEIYCKTTAIYNKVMEKQLPEFGIEFIEINRKKEILNYKEEYISASKIRKAIKDNELNNYLHLLPESTQDFFNSKEAEKIIETIKQSDARH